MLNPQLSNVVSARMRTPTTANNQNRCRPIYQPTPCRRRRWPRLAPRSSDSSPRRSDEPCHSQQRRWRFCCHIRIEIPVWHRSSMRKRSPNSRRRRNSPPILFARPKLTRKPQPPPWKAAQSSSHIIPDGRSSSRKRPYLPENFRRQRRSTAPLAAAIEKPGGDYQSIVAHCARSGLAITTAIL
jgi:hypothetical protein